MNDTLPSDNMKLERAGLAAAAARNAPVDRHANIFHLSELPAETAIEADLTIHDDFYNNEHRTVVWELKKTRITGIAETILSNVEHCEDFMETAYALSEDIRKNGLERPVVLGPCGIEGNHRIVACYLAGIKTIPAYVARFAPRGFRPEKACHHQGARA